MPARVNGATAPVRFRQLRARLRRLPPLDEAGLRPAQVRAVRGLEASLAADKLCGVDVPSPEDDDRAYDDKANVLFFDKRPARPGRPWTEQLWVYDLRTGQHFTQKQNPLRREHLQDFVECYRPEQGRAARLESERFKSFSYDELLARDKTNLDITWLRDPEFDDPDHLLPPGVIAREIVEDLEAALSEFAAIAEYLQRRNNGAY